MASFGEELFDVYAYREPAGAAALASAAGGGAARVPHRMEFHGVLPAPRPQRIRHLLPRLPRVGLHVSPGRAHNFRRNVGKWQAALCLRH